MQSLSIVNETWSAPFFAPPGLTTREAGSPWEKCQRVWCLCRNLAVKRFSSFAAAVLLLGPSWRMMSTNICHPCSTFCLALTVSFHQVSFLWLLFQQQVQLICWFSSAAPLHSSGPLFLFAFNLEFMTSRYTGSQTPMYETHFLFSLFCVEGLCEKLPSSSSKDPMAWVPSTQLLANRHFVPTVFDPVRAQKALGHF